MRVDGGKSTVGPRHKSETAEEKKRREQLSLRKAKKRRKDREEKELARIEMAEEKEEEDDEDYGLNNEFAGIKKTTKTHRNRPLKAGDQEDDQEDSDKLVFKKRKHKKHRSARDKEYENDSNESSSASSHHHSHKKHSQRSANQAMTNKVGIPWIRRHTIATNTMEVKKEEENLLDKITQNKTIQERYSGGGQDC